MPRSLLIFLDIDGVLDPAGRPSQEPHFNPSCLSVLEQILRAYTAQIVMTTSWRASISPAAFEQFFTRQGLNASVVGSTPLLANRWGPGETTCRGDEILAWLSDNPPKPGTALLVLEDSEELGPVSRFGYYTDPFTGLKLSDIPLIRTLIDKQFASKAHAQ